MPTLQEKALLVKLFYLNQQNSVAAVKEFRHMKQMRKGPMSPCALRKIIQKFQTTMQIGILPGGGRKQIPSSSVEDVAIAVVEAPVSRHMVVTGTQSFEQLLHFSSLPESWLTSNGHGAFCGVTKPTFASMEITANGIQTCPVIGQGYRAMLRDFVIPQLQQRGCLQDIIFMHDGAPPHSDRRVKQLLRQHFKDARVISRHFPTAWPPRSPDITFCDF
ncbi:hypothetical protein AVEN_191069-1 [Araneus ventricosus]|uniref:DUF4817 domain-containing protein n=1 Tax=Araneus ventricosus TaxID=182803 RepID=A0A4Y2AXX6_ARAVE|nr:hypothetical protein AVEN_191069-1 [Araneus ventricosus]